MVKKNLAELMKQNSYPGRGIMVGRSADGRHAVIAYFIMGRSENSRNLIFVEDGDGIRTQAFDESKMEDPSLIIYAPVRVLGSKTIVTNGDQTDTIFDGLDRQLTFEQSLRERRYEPDEPNYTPRISAVVHLTGGAFNYAISILKSADGNPLSDQRFTYSYTSALPGEGHFISTYLHDGSPLPSFEGEPVRVEVGDDQDQFTAELWEALNADNKVSLFTRFIDLKDGSFTSRIVNRHTR